MLIRGLHLFDVQCLLEEKRYLIHFVCKRIQLRIIFHNGKCLEIQAVRKYCNLVELFTCITWIFFVLYARNVCFYVILRILWKDSFFSCLSDLNKFNFIDSHKFNIVLKSRVLTIFQIADFFMLQAIKTHGKEQEKL